MLFVVTLISLLVHIYSHRRTCEDDIRYTHYFAVLSLFTASMLTLVVADNTLQLLARLGAASASARSCSSATGGRRSANTDAALKAFLTTRTGDIGLMIGIIILFFAAGQTFNIVAINALRARARAPTTRMLLAGVVLSVHRHHRQERPVPAAHLAARRHGRPDAGVGADPRRHHGRRRRLPRSPGSTPVLRGLLDRRRRRQPHGAHRRHHDHHRRRARPSCRTTSRRCSPTPPISQLGYMVMAPRRRRVDRRRCSTSSPTRSSRPASSSAPAR